MTGRLLPMAGVIFAIWSTAGGQKTPEPDEWTVEPTTSVAAPSSTEPTWEFFPSTSQYLDTTTSAVTNTIQNTTDTTQSPGVDTLPPIQETTTSTMSSTQTTDTASDRPTMTPSTIAIKVLPEVSTPATISTSSAQVVEYMSAQELTNYLETVDYEELSPAQQTELVAAVQAAPDSVRRVFESKVNIFGGATEAYVPLGSLVPVKTRRIIIITTAVVLAAPTLRRRRT